MHDSYMLLMPQDGAMICQFAENAAPRLVRPGEALMVAPRIMHRTISEDATSRHLALYPPARRLSSWMMADETYRIAVASAPVMTLLAYHAALPPGSARAALAERLILEEALAETPVRTGEDHGRALTFAIAAWLRARLREKHSLDDLARRFGISRRHLTRLFRRHIGTGIIDYLAQQRVNEAARRIAAGEDVLAAAAAVGIGSPSHLARLFRQHSGQAPSTARSGAN